MCDFETETLCDMKINISKKKTNVLSINLPNSTLHSLVMKFLQILKFKKNRKQHFKKSCVQTFSLDLTFPANPGINVSVTFLSRETIATFTDCVGIDKTIHLTSFYFRCTIFTTEILSNSMCHV